MAEYQATPEYIKRAETLAVWQAEQERQKQVAEAPSTSGKGSGLAMPATNRGDDPPQDPSWWEQGISWIQDNVVSPAQETIQKTIVEPAQQAWNDSVKTFTQAWNTAVTNTTQVVNDVQKNVTQFVEDTNKAIRQTVDDIKLASITFWDTIKIPVANKLLTPEIGWQELNNSQYNSILADLRASGPTGSDARKLH
ncbi:MAG: hypothetical protein L6461_23975 [Anaerolineae bacterium]|nr:hypothetical protein [Anaerolineae bacterium]